MDSSFGPLIHKKKKCSGTRKASEQAGKSDQTGVFSVWEKLCRRDCCGEDMKETGGSQIDRQKLTKWLGTV